MSQTSLSSLIWSVADLLRGDYKPHEYGRVILPFTVLRRLDCVLAPTKTAVLAELAAKEVLGINPQPFVERITGVPFANTSALDLRTLICRHSRTQLLCAHSDLAVLRPSAKCPSRAGD